jgi:hypothetical protein
MTTERQPYYTAGPRFFMAEDGKRTLFSYRVDSASEIGPREATAADKAKHPGAWAKFEAERPVVKKTAEAKRASA